MARFRDLPIRSKLMIGFTLTSLVALLIMMGALTVYDRKTFREEAQADLNVLAGVIGENGSSSLVFNDPETARSTLGALKSQSHIVAGFLFDRDGKLFASYMTPHAGSLPQRAPADGMRFSARHLDVVRPVAFNNARVGTIFLRSDLSEMQERRTRYLILAVIVLAAAWFISLLMSSAFQRAISKPIVSLLNVAKRVSREKNYALRAEKSSDDEVGKLIDGFNEMLVEIRKRDAEIQERHRQEMALARSIQTSVLPRTFELPGFEVSAIMMPAEEVGGDFYEFRPVADSMGGGAWIGVGDVTGHGVTSGLIMMMAQSMFTMLCEQSNGHVSPAKFVSLLNRAMYYNLRSRLAQDRFMTLVVAKIDGDGTMVYAGAHTDLLIYRAATRSVERIPTDGLWLGITDDIAPLTSDATVTLAPGDVALFHTDGVTEARNAAGECFDVHRLTQHLRDLHDAPASQLVTTIAQAAWSWAGTPKDDVSLLALKRSHS